ncbi:MAG: class I SAM-dependent methyltransferase [Thermodesulfobacteriota bacterium]
MEKKLDFDVKQLAAIKGFMDDEEAAHLYRVAREAAGLGPCLEIGSYCGKSAVCLGSGCREAGGILFSIDHHRGSEEQQAGEEYFDPALYDYRAGRVNTLPAFLAALEHAGLTGTVVPIVCASDVAARAWATPLSLVFIDGGHALETAVTDYRCWAHHLMPGGFLLIHDIFENPEEGGQAPYEVYKLAQSSGLFAPHSRVRTLGVLRRK